METEGKRNPLVYATKVAFMPECCWGIKEKRLILDCVVVCGFLSTTWEAFKDCLRQTAGRQVDDNNGNNENPLGVSEKTQAPQCTTQCFRKKKTEGQVLKGTMVEEVESHVPCTVLVSLPH